MKKLGSLFVMAFVLFLGCSSLPEKGAEESGKKKAPDGVTPTKIKIIRFVKVDADGTTKLKDGVGNELLQKVEVHTKGLSQEAVLYITPADGEASTPMLVVRQKDGNGVFTLLPKETVNIGRVDAYFGDENGKYSRIFDVPKAKWHGVATVQHKGQKGHLLRLVGALPAGPRRSRFINGTGALDVPGAIDSAGNTTEVLVKSSSKKKKKGAYND